MHATHWRVAYIPSHNEFVHNHETRYPIQPTRGYLFKYVFRLPQFVRSKS